jgi:hypothetical protein
MAIGKIKQVYQLYNPKMLLRLGFFREEKNA